MCSEIALKVDHLTKIYELYGRGYQKTLGLLFPYRFKHRKFTALDDVSFEVGKGECLGIMGANGSGKSTLLQLLAGNLHATAGEISADGRIVSLLELGSWFNSTYTGRENIYMAGYSQGLSRRQIDRHLDSIIEFAEIGEFIDQPLSTYSTGMMMRLAFATNINIEADILLLDEVFAVGDARFVQKCLAFIKDYIRDKTVLLVSHDANAIGSLCHRALLLERGRLALLGDTLAVTERYLARSYAEKQPVGEAAGAASRDVAVAADCRGTDVDNVVRLSVFNPEAEGFGAGGAEIEDVRLTDEGGAVRAEVCGGELVRLSVRVRAKTELRRASVGFVVKDPCGQYVFGDSTIGQPFESVLASGTVFEAKFEFVLPRLQNGVFSIACAVAEGPLETHRIQVWRHRALTLAVKAPLPLQGVLLGIPMKSIQIHTVQE